MSIDITCYTLVDVDDLKEKLGVVRAKYSHLFDGPYLMFEPHKILSRQQIESIEDRVEKYNEETKLLIAEEYGLEKPRSYFLIAVNDKSFPELNTYGMANVIRRELGTENVIVLLNGEDLI